MSQIRLPITIVASPFVLNEIAMKHTSFEEFSEAIKELAVNPACLKFDAVQIKKVKQFYETSCPIKLKNYILKRLSHEQYVTLDKKIYAGLYTITGFIKSGNELYVRTEMPEETALMFHELQLPSDQWVFFYSQVKRILPMKNR